MISVLIGCFGCPLVAWVGGAPQLFPAPDGSPPELASLARLAQVHLLPAEMCRVLSVFEIEGGREEERDRQVIFNFPHQLITLLCAGER